MTMRAWDIETTTTTSFKRKANPYDKANWVVTHAYQDRDGKVIEHRFGKQRPLAGWFKPVLEGCKLLCGMNIKFDISHAIQDGDNYAAWKTWIVSGGLIWDIQLAEYLLEGMTQRNHMLSLDEIAPRYGGQVKIDEVKLLWKMGVQTQDIEPALLSRYLCGGSDEHGVDQLGDVGNTMMVAIKQIARARGTGQLNSILLNMGALVFSIEAEHNGMFVDKEKGLALADDLRHEIEALKVSLDAALPALPFTFNWGSTRHKSALIFGGAINYPAYEYTQADGLTIFKHDYDALPAHEKPTLAYAQMEVECVKPVGDVPASALPHMVDGLVPLAVAKDANITVERFASGKRQGEVKIRKVKIDDPSKPKGRMAQACFTLPRMTEPKKEWGGATPGVYSVSAAIIDELGDRGIPFLRDLKRYSGLVKDLGTYFIAVELDEAGNVVGEKGMLTMVDDDGIIHHRINHTNTVSGRLSSSDPNLQNIPKGNKSAVKTVFVSRFGSGLIIQSDFSSLEIYVQAILTGCKQLIADLKAGLDLHCVRLAAVENMPYDEVVKLAKGYKLPDGTRVPPVQEWDYKRTKAKGFSFQRAYGAGADAIATSTGMTKDEVEKLIAAEEERYPEIAEYNKKLTDQVRANRRAIGRVIPHPEVNGVLCHIGESRVQLPDGKVYTFTESPSPKYFVERGQFCSFSPTEIKNYGVQGTGAEFAKAAMTIAVIEFYRRDNFGGRALLVNQVHDAVYADSAPEVKEQAAALLHACMEAASDYMEYKFKWQLPLPVPSDTSAGPDMMSDEGIADIKQMAAPARAAIRRKLFNNFTPSWELRA